MRTQGHLVPGARVLDVGSGSGYLTAAMALMVRGHMRMVGRMHAGAHQAHAQGAIGIADSDLAAAMALGAVLQPCVFKLYGRLPGAMRAHAPQLASAALRVLESSSRSS